MQTQHGPPPGLLILTLVALAGTAAAAGEGPAIDLPDDPAAAEPAAATGTSIGGYAEVHFNYSYPADAAQSKRGTLDFHRLVLYVGHEFTDDLSFYSEIEVEHASEIFVEQAYLDYRLWGDKLTLRAGMVLVPMGIVNSSHEPPTFNGVERSLLANRIIPSTWREAGVGFVGEPLEGLRYRLFVVGGLDALGFSAKSGLRGGRQKVIKSRANAFAVTGRVEYEPILGLLLGASAYLGDAGPNAGPTFDTAGVAQELVVNVAGVSADARFRRSGLQARAVVATFSLGDTRRLREAFDSDGAPIGPDVGSLLLGYYVEAGYDLFDRLDTPQKLVPFVRLESTDTLASVQGRPAAPEDGDQRLQDIVVGVSYLPIPQVVFKADLDIRRPGLSRGETIANLGVGLQF